MISRLRPIDVARALGRSVTWLKQQERLGRIPQPERDPLNNQRCYAPEAVEQIRDTLLARVDGKN